MKKIFSLVLIVAMTFGIMMAFAGCGKTDAPVSNVSNDGKLICGVTIYEPMNYKDASGAWTGFDTEFAQLVGEKLEMDVEFQEIEWKSKYSELAAGTINCIWNGFTANSEDEGKKRSELVDFSHSYMLNQQCVVVKAADADNYKDIESLAGKTASAEKGSAGEPVAKEAIGDSGKMIDSPSQVATLMEVKSGAVDFVVIDILLAQKLTGTGNYSDLAIADIELESEVYAVGFKKGSDLTVKVNAAIKELFEEGKMEELAKKYNLENSLVLDVDFKG